jgi:hypothetical protein
LIIIVYINFSKAIKNDLKGLFLSCQIQFRYDYFLFCETTKVVRPATNPREGLGRLFFSTNCMLSV